MPLKVNHEEAATSRKKAKQLTGLPKDFTLTTKNSAVLTGIRQTNNCYKISTTAGFNNFDAAALREAAELFEELADRMESKAA